MPLSRDELLDRLAALGIETETVAHPPAFTVAESRTIHIPLPGAHTKNLFLKDEKGTLVLVIAKSTTAMISRISPGVLEGPVFIRKARAAQGCARRYAGIRYGICHCE